MLHRENLWAYQQRLSTFQRNTPFNAGWVDMGLGKTVSTLTSFRDELDAFNAHKMLVFAPLRVARKVWSDEIDRWFHLNGLRVSKIIGTPKQRWEAMWRDADVYLTNREQTGWIEAQFIEGTGKKFKQIRPWPWDTVVLDEAQSYKSQSASRWQSMRRIRRLHEIERMWQLTGTPTPNGYIDIWGQIQLLDQGRRLGFSEDAYVDRWFDRVNMESYTSYKIKDHSAAEIQRFISDIVLTLRAEDYLDLPPVHYNEIRVDLPPQALQTYKKFAREYLAEISGVKLTAVNAGVCAGKLLQLANGAAYHLNREWVHFHDAKIDALLETLEGCFGPVLIAYGYQHDKARISEALTKYCGKVRTWRVLDTEQDEDDWNAGKIDYLLLHPAGAGHGLNLQYSGSENIVWFGLTNNLEWYQQLNARLGGGHRALGKNLAIHHLIAEETYDRNMMDLLRLKGVTQDDLKLSLTRLQA
jgi:SNF2 family DNA or RNA helicase